jgi:mandelamide amidase
MKKVTRFFFNSSIAVSSLLSTQFVYAIPFDCTNMKVHQIKRALDNHLITSQSCVNQLLQRINTLSPVNTPHVVNDYQGLQTFPGLNAYIYLNPNLVQQAIQADQLRAAGVKKPLLGVPIAIKDTIPVAGYPNSSGNLYLSNQYTPPNNDPGIQRLLDAGAILIGQNNQHEFGSGLTGINFSYGPIRNAHDDTRVGGGSTGGGAVAVASKIAPVAIGDDLAGSLRVPAALNGVIGYRPSVSRYASPTNSSLTVPFAPYPSIIDEKDKMDVRGIVARSIRDVVLIDKFLSEDGGVQPNLRKKIRGIRLGVPANFYTNMEPDVAKVIQKAFKKLEGRGAILVKTPNIPNIDPAQPIPGFISPITTYQGLWFAKSSIFLGGTRYWAQANNITLNPIGADTTAGMALIYQILSILYPSQAAEEAYYMNVLMPATNGPIQAYEQYFIDNNLDAVIYPTSLLAAAKIETIVVNGGNPLTNGLYDFAYTTQTGRTGGVSGFYNENGLLSPLLGTPALSMPIGLTAGDRLPVGLEIDGLRGQDSKLMEVGAAIQSVFGVHLHQ